MSARSGTATISSPSAFRIGWLGLELGADLLGMSLAALIAWALHAANVSRPTPIALYLPWLALLLAVQPLLFALTGMYRREKQLLNVGELRALLLSLALGYLLLGTLLFWLRSAASGGFGGTLPGLAELHARLAGGFRVEALSRFVVTATFALAWPLCAALRQLLFHLARNLGRRGVGDVPMALAGSAAGVRRLRRRLERAPLVGGHVAGCFLPERESWSASLPLLLGSYRELGDALEARAIRVLWVAGDPRGEPGASLAALDLPACALRFSLEPFPGYRTRRGSEGELWLEPVARSEYTIASGIQRGFDLLVGAPLLLIALPLLALLALGVRLSSPGPALIRQQRAGRRGRAFGMWKLRTMHCGARLQAGQRKRPDDPRVTRIGRWLRRFSLDELPQLWNVMRGDMSLVGPRPELADIAARYDDHARARLAVRPGLTGLWQVSPARRRPIHEELDYDLYYVRHRGIWLDLTILMLTAFAVLRGVGAR